KRSIINRMAQGLSKRGVTDPVDVYGVDAAQQPRLTKTGFYYATSVRTAAGLKEIVFEATKISIDGNTMAQSSVPEVPLRRPEVSLTA
ncbi:MAG TPA: hypothetical protein VFM05_13380, partial [Candidatus Saccharimonadales bacterium]|nr:hypothetical protein [Candidatus Saccharimonadales bacterium]